MPSDMVGTTTHTHRWIEPLKMPSHMVGTTTHTHTGGYSFSHPIMLTMMCADRNTSMGIDLKEKLGNLAPPSRKFTFKTCNIHFFLCWNIAQKHVKMTVSKPVGSPRVTVFTITQPRWAKVACEHALYVSWVFSEELKPVLPFFCTANFFSPW